MSLNLGGLFFLFLVLKLTSIITWSWWWVTCPLWIAPVIFVVLFVVLFFIAFGVALVASLFDK